MTEADTLFKGLSKREKDDLARRHLAAQARKKAQNARARTNKKASGEVRVEKWVARDQVADIRRLLSLYVDARQRGEALWIRVAPSPDEQESSLVVDETVFLTQQRPMVSAGQVGKPGTHPEAASPRDLFHTPGYTEALKDLVAGIIVAEGPLPRDVLELRVAKHHGYGATGTKIRERIASCLEGVELHDETQNDGKRTFLWAKGTFGSRAPWRGRRDRALADISCREWADFLDKHESDLEMAEKPVREAARLVGVQVLTESTGRLLTAYREWWRANPMAIDHGGELLEAAGQLGRMEGV